jgi:molybdopterin-guanine dinucleotide biosynthesis protein A
VIEDASGDFPGPLAGILAGLTASRSRYLLTLPVDAPLVSEDYPARMASALAESGHKACVASLNQRIEPVFCLLETTLAQALQTYLDRGQRTVNGWLDEIGAIPVDFSDTPQQFINLNVEQDQEKLREYLPS